MREALAASNHSKIQGAFLQEGIKWSFNPPTASHRGSSWERITRMVRRVLTLVLHQQTLSDEEFHTGLCEVEAILNDGPITKLSGDPNDLEALTPNLLLTIKRKPALPPGLFEKTDLYIQRHRSTVHSTRCAPSLSAFKSRLKPTCLPRTFSV